MSSPSPSLVLLAPLRIEARALAAGAPAATVERVGMGPRRASAAAGRLALPGALPAGAAVVLAGLGGALVDGLAIGELVVADRVVDPEGRVVAEMPGAALLAAELRRAGLPAREAAVVTTDRIVHGGAARAALAGTGAAVVDMESAAVAAAPWATTPMVVRAVSDGPGRELRSAARIADVRTALRALRAAGPVLESWAAAAGARRVLLASPRSFCAGVERAIATVEAAIDRFGRPVYVRRQIVHNDHVVARLEARGAVFVRELSEVPDGATVVFSAHGVSPAVRAEAGARPLTVVDATCPLVAKVHHEVRRHAAAGRSVVLIGHAGHDEIEGTLGEVEGISLIDVPDDVASLDLEAASPVAYATQTTLAPDEVAATVAALEARFADLAGPRASDICYATHNRQEAVRAAAAEADLVLVVGSATSSNSRRLVEVARRAGCRAELVDDVTGVRAGWLAGAARVAVTAGASAPEHLVTRLVAALGSLGPLEVVRGDTKPETVSFPLPPEVR